MSKRFRDTGIWDKDWYVGLTCAERCALDFIFCRCDPVGVWAPAFNTGNKMIGELVDWGALPGKVNGNIVVMDDGKWWLKDFCFYQYGILKPESASKVQKSLVSMLVRHGLWDAYLATVEPRVPRTLQDKEKEKVKEKDKEKDKDKELYHSVERAFLSKNDNKFDDYPAEGRCINAIIKKARNRSPDDPASLLHAMLNAFWKLKKTDTTAKGFWRGQPFLPSALSPMWSRVLETMREDVVDPAVMKLIKGGVA